MKCQPFPGPGINHISTFNPIKEFLECDSNYLDHSFEKFKRKHNKKYNDLSEHVHRKEMFKQNTRYKCNIRFMMNL